MKKNVVYRLYFYYKGFKNAKFEREFNLRSAAVLYAEDSLRDSIMSTFLTGYKIVNIKK